MKPKDHGCKLPPSGWWCSRKPGHKGPCAARKKKIVCPTCKGKRVYYTKEFSGNNSYDEPTYRQVLHSCTTCMTYRTVRIRKAGYA